MLGQRTFCFSILPLEGYRRSQQKLRKHTKLNAVLLPRFLALYKLQDFLSQELHLCVLQTVMNFSFCEFVYFLFSHANFGHPQNPVLMPLTFNLPLLQKTLLFLSNLLFLVPICPTLLLPPLIIYGFLLPPSSDISFPTQDSKSIQSILIWKLFHKFEHPVTLSQFHFILLICRRKDCMQSSGGIHLTNLSSSMTVSILFSISPLITSGNGHGQPALGLPV